MTSLSRASKRKAEEQRRRATESGVHAPSPEVGEVHATSATSATSAAEVEVSIVKGQ